RSAVIEETCMTIVDKLIGRVAPERAMRRAERLSGQGQQTQAFEALAAAARAGSADAQFRIALCYFEGTGVPASRHEGARWLTQAAEAGHAQAQIMLASLHLHGLARPGDGDTGDLFSEASEGEP